MNAYELADELDRLHEKLYLHWDEDSPRLQNAATMLRQQQAEIEALKAELRLIDELVTGKTNEK